jgi:lipoprotein signal peptidase
MTTCSPRSFRWLLWTLALVGLALDQVGKYGVFKILHNRALASPDRKAVQTVIPGALELHVELTDRRFPENAGPLRTWSGEYQPHVNKGAFSGFGNGDGGGMNFNLGFAVISVLAAGAIVWWSTRRSIGSDPVLCAALGLILAGTLGNLYDRIVFDGVRDFLYWFFIIPTLVFNIADFCLVCGACTLLVQAFWSKPAAEKPAASVVATSAEMAEVK